MAQQNGFGNVVIDDRDQFLLPTGRIAFHSLFVPKTFQEGQKPKYGLTLLFPPEETFESYKQAVERLKKLPEFSKLAVLPGSAEEQQRLNMGLTKEDIVYADAFIKGLAKAIKKETNVDTLEKYPFMTGQWRANANCYFPPVVLSPDKTPIKIDQKELVYSGCYGQALVSVGIHNKDKIFLRLHAFQKQKNGESLGRASAKTDVFSTFTEDDYGNSLAEETEV